MYYPWVRIVVFLMAITLVMTAVIFGVVKRNSGIERGVENVAAQEDSNELSSLEEQVAVEEENNQVIQELPEVEQIGKGQIVALTFDDGPSEYTNQLLDVLKREKVPATFFVLGNRASAYPEVIKREIAEGHEVESHTMSHQNLTKLSEASMRAEITGATETICRIEGKANCIKYLRPPYGEISDTLRQVVGVPMIGWSIDTEDWKSKNPQMIQDRTLGMVSDGSVVLMHDIYETSIKGAEMIIRGLKAAGFTFVTVDEMIREKEAVLGAGSYFGRFD